MRDMPKKPLRPPSGRTRSGNYRLLGFHRPGGRRWRRDVPDSNHPRPCGYGLPLVLHSRAGHPTPAALAPTTSQGGSSAPATVAILGDPYSGGLDVGGTNDANWTKLIAASLAAAGKPISLSVFTDSSAGYVKPIGGAGTALAQRVSQIVKPDDRVVVVFPSSSDSEQSRDAVRSAAHAQIKSTAPGATLIVVGQSWTSDRPPSNVTGLRDTLRAEAAAAGAVFVDPLTDKWFVNDTGKLVGSDGVHLTDQGHKYLQPRITAALG